LAKSSTEYENILINSAESPIEMPKKNDKNTVRAEKAATIKWQVIVDKKSQQIICTDPTSS
jgi:hypothetical protein